jgi:hypothetical protein
MLPAYIIEDLLKRDREQNSSDELCIECPEIIEPSENNRPTPAEEEKPERGVAIIDFTL